MMHDFADDADSFSSSVDTQPLFAQFDQAQQSNHHQLRKRISNCAKQYFPILCWFPSYSFNKDFPKDCLAGFTVGVMCVPQALSYATVAGLPPVHGLYSAFVGIFPYIFFGTSPHLMPGPTAVMSMIVKGSVPKQWNGHTVEEESEEWVYLAQSLAFLAGLVQIMLFVLGLGYLSEFVAEPVISGFTSAAAVLIICSQLPSLLGVPKCDPADLLGEEHRGEECYLHEVVYSMVKNLENINGPTVLCSCCSICLLIVFSHRVKSKDSLFRTVVGSLGPLVVVILSIILMYCLTSFHGEVIEGNGTKAKYFDSLYHIRYVGPIPSGLPSTSNPFTPITDFRGFAELLQNVLPVALIGFMEAMTIALTVARRTGHGKVIPQNELLGLGSCNVACSLFQGYPVTGSFSRTSINADTGAQSPFGALIAAVVIGVCLETMTGIVQYTPKFALASVVASSVIKLVDFDEARTLWRVHRKDFSIFMIVFSVTLFFGVTLGLTLGILASFVLALRSSSSIEIAAVAFASRNEANRLDEGTIAVVTPHCNLTFANVHNLSLGFSVAVDLFLPNWVIIDCTRVNELDTSGLKMMDEFVSNLKTAESQTSSSYVTKICIASMGHNQLEYVHKYKKTHVLAGVSGPWEVIHSNELIPENSNFVFFVGSIKDALNCLKASVTRDLPEAAESSWFSLCPQVTDSLPDGISLVSASFES